MVELSADHRPYFVSTEHLEFGRFGEELASGEPFRLLSNGANPVAPVFRGTRHFGELQTRSRKKIFFLLSSVSLDTFRAASFCVRVRRGLSVLIRCASYISSPCFLDAVPRCVLWVVQARGLLESVCR